MERTRFISVMAGGFLAAPRASKAQQAGTIYRIGILGNVPFTDPGGARLWGVFGVKTARALGLAIPPSLLRGADEVIQ